MNPSPALRPTFMPTCVRSRKRSGKQPRPAAGRNATSPRTRSWNSSRTSEPAPPVMPSATALAYQLPGPLRLNRHNRRIGIIQVAGPGNAAGLQGRAEPGGHPDHVVVVRPAGAHHRPRVVVDEREKIRLLPADHRPVERVARPHLVRPRALEPAEGPLLLGRPRGRPV